MTMVSKEVEKDVREMTDERLDWYFTKARNLFQIYRREYTRRVRAKREKPKCKPPKK